MEFIKNKTIPSYLTIAGAIIALVTMIIGAATKGLVMDTFSGVIITMFILGIIASLAGFVFDKIPFISILPLIFYGIAFGLIFFDGIEPMTYASIGVDNDVGGDANMVLVYLVLTGIAMIVQAIPLFFKQNKNR